jgi:hypothetical protein
MFAVEITYEWHETDEKDETFTCETVEEAAQLYESEAITANQPLADIVEELGFHKLRLESLDPETGKKVVAYELELAGVS